LAEPQVGIGDHPYFLAIEPRESPGKPLLIDLESPGWVTTHAEYMRAPGTWYLMPKDGNSRLPRLSVLVSEGEQPYYAAKHVGVAGSGGSNEVVVYGIGKKRLDGVVDRLWVLPNGIVCGGDDVEAFGIAAVKRLGPK
jgi:hypothetical protein